MQRYTKFLGEHDTFAENAKVLQVNKVSWANFN